MMGIVLRRNANVGSIPEGRGCPGGTIDDGTIDDGINELEEEREEEPRLESGEEAILDGLIDPLDLL